MQNYLWSVILRSKATKNLRLQSKATHKTEILRSFQSLRMTLL
jgi:hypothetical protein